MASTRGHHRWLALAVVLVAACAGPGAPAPGRSGVVGEVRLVPPEAARSSGSTQSAYGDRRLRDAELVDYSRPGFAVVYVDEPTSAPSAAPPTRLTIRDGAVRPRLDAEHLALRRGASLRIENDSDAHRIVSAPAIGLVRRLAPGELLELTLRDIGEQTVYLLDSPGEQCRVFVAPGPFVVVSRSGDFVLNDLEPGQRTVRVWHPRFPSANRSVELVRDEFTRTVILLGVGQTLEVDDDDA